MSRGQAPTDRRWRDPTGMRRGSVEFGGKSPGRKPRRKRQSSTVAAREGRAARLGRRLRAVGRFGAKHRGSLLAAVGCAGLAATAGLALIGLELAVLAVAGLVSGGVLLAGGAMHVHDRSHTMHRSANVTSPTWSQRRTINNNRRGGDYFDGTPQGGRVHVTSHDRDTGEVREHTRGHPRAGAGAGAKAS